MRHINMQVIWFCLPNWRYIMSDLGRCGYVLEVRKDTVGLTLGCGDGYVDMTIPLSDAPVDVKAGNYWVTVDPTFSYVEDWEKRDISQFQA